MSRFEYATSLAALRCDASLSLTGFRFMASVNTYARLNGWVEMKHGDRVRFFADPANKWIGFRRMKATKDGEALTVVCPYGGAAPAINNARLAGTIETTFRTDVDLAEWSLLPREFAPDLDFAFEPSYAAKKRVKTALESIPAIAERHGFRPCPEANSTSFVGECHTVLFADGRLTPMSRGKQGPEFHACVPFVSPAALEAWFRDLCRRDRE